MKIVKMLDDEEYIETAAKLVFEDEDSEFSPKSVAEKNAEIGEKSDKLGDILIKYKGYGWYVFGAALAVYILSFALSGIIFFDVIFSLLGPVVGIALAVWCFVWLSYWLAPLKHCTFCKAFYSREVVFEKKVPNLNLKTVVKRTVSKNINDAQGNKIGSIDEDVDVAVVRVGYYTVFRCKKCGKLKVEIIVKEFDA